MVIKTSWKSTSPKIFYFADISLEAAKRPWFHEERNSFSFSFRVLNARSQFTRLNG